MDREPLEILRTLSETGSLRQAAKRMHKSQPALSAMIQKLEAEVGFELLDRRGYKARLSERGEVFLDRARPLLEGFERLEDLSRSLVRGFEPRLGLAVSALYPLERLLARLETFGALFADTEVRLWIELLGGTWERLMEGQADLAIAAEPKGGSSHPETLIERQWLTQVALLPVYGAQSPLKDCQLSDQALRTQPQILVAETARQGPQGSLDYLKGAPHWHVGSFEILKRILLDGTGWGSLPRHMIEPELAQGRLVAFETPSFGVQYLDLYLQRPAQRILGAAGLTLWQLLLQDKQSQEGAPT
ncbi:MAG: LysR family transcriptional regulator [bacterium]|nr:LysR family transcriptional regulator [bacterium]